MSTTTVYYSSFTGEFVELAELRRQQRAAREAVRRAEAIAAEQRRYEDLQAELDGARPGLPDLVYQLRALPKFADPATARSWVDERASELRAAISRAREILHERQRRIAARRAYNALRDALATEIDLCGSLARAARVSFAAPTLPDVPGEDATSAAITGAHAALQLVADSLGRQKDHLLLQTMTRERTAAAAGPAREARSATEAATEYELQVIEDARAEVGRQIEAALVDASMSADELPTAQRVLIEWIAAHGADHRFATDLIGREAGRKRDRIAALALREKPPVFLDPPRLARRWAELASALEGVAAGVLSWTPKLEHEWTQLHADSRSAARSAYAEASFLTRAAEEDVEIADGEEEGLVIMTLPQHGGYRVEMRQEALENGGVVTAAEVIAEPGADAGRDGPATDALCEFLERLQHGDGVQSTVVHEREREPRVERRARPKVMTVRA